MTELEEMKAYVGFTEDDEAQLKMLWPFVEPKAFIIAERFYERIEAFAEARAVFESEDQVNRLKRTMQGWMRELMTGPWDEAYGVRRRRIGRRHVEVGLAHRYMFTAMSQLREEMCQVAHDAASDPDPACHAIGKITTIDLALMTGTYMNQRAQDSAVSLQDLILSNLPLWVLVGDREGRVLTATGPLRPDDMVGRPYTEALPAALVETTALDKRVRRALEKGRVVSMPRVDVEIDGEQRHMGVHVIPLDHPHASFLLHVEDLTAAVQTEARHAAREALAKLGELSAGVAHELRNPLAGISGAVQVIGASFDADDRRQAIMGKVQEQIGRLNRLVTDLLTFARPGQANLDVVLLHDAVTSALDLVRVESPGVSLEIRGEGRALADADHLHRIVLNLIRNAAQALGGEGRILVDIEDGHVRVSDDGPGVPEELKGRLFEPFVTTRAQGTGLGLAICGSSAELMGGEIRLVDDGPLQGACFELILLTDLNRP